MTTQQSDQADPIDKIRGPLVAGVAREPERRHRRRATVTVVVAAGVIGTVGLLLATAVPTTETAREGTIIAGDPPSISQVPLPGSDATADLPSGVWSIRQPPQWDRAGSELMPVLGWESLTLATVELRSSDTGCAHLPTQALQDLGPTDALASVFFTGPTGTDSALDGFSEAALARNEDHDAHVCAERDDLVIYWDLVDVAGQASWVLVAFGPDAPPELQSTTWDMLASLRPGEPAEGPPECVITAPSDEPATLPTEGHGVYGTPDLSTALPFDGFVGWRKSIWSSEDWPGAGTEPRPDIATTWERLDRPRAPINAGLPGTNASGMMLSGIDPAERGCWEVTATYKGHELSYVYWNPGDDLPNADQTPGPGGSLGPR